MAELWYTTKKENKSLATSRHARDLLNNHIYPTFGNAYITDIKAFQVESLVNSKLASGLTDTAKRILATIKSVMRFALSNEIIDRDVTAGIDSPHIAKKPRMALNSYEISVIKQAASTHRFGAAILAMLYTGMRREEMIALKKSDVSMRTNSIAIQRGMYFDGNSPREKPTKNGESRTVPIVDILKPTLAKQIVSTKSDYVFPGRDGKMLTSTAYRGAMESFIKACNEFTTTLGTEPIYFTAHQLRHTYCTSLYYAGISVKKAQELMGHHSSQMTLDLYTHLDTERESNTQETLNKFFTSDTHQYIMKTS